MSNDVLNSLLKEYEQKKLKAELDLDIRKQNLYKLIPRLEEIDNELNKKKRWMILIIEKLFVLPVE